VVLMSSRGAPVVKALVDARGVPVSAPLNWFGKVIGAVGSDCNSGSLVPAWMTFGLGVDRIG